MTLELETRRVEPDIEVVVLRGRIILGAEAQRVEKTLADLLRQGARKVVLDLSGVDYIDSTGIAVVAYGFFQMQQAAGMLRLAGATERVLREFKMMRLDTLLGLDDTVESACKGLAAGSGV